MTKFLQDLYGPDRVNQAVALLGGATAPSYGAVSLDGAENLLETGLGVLPSDSDAYVTTPQRQADQDKSLGGDKSELDSATSSLRTAGPSNVFADEPTGFEPVAPQQVAPDVDLITRFQTPDSDDFAPGAFLPIDPRGGAAAAEPVALNTVTSSVPSFLEQLILKVEEASRDISTDLDGGTQGAVRELIFEIGSDLSTTVRMGLQDNVSGMGRELAARLLDEVNIDTLDAAAAPLLAIDYYGASASVINGILDSIAQPIGSIALPQVGPFVADLKGELVGFAA